MKRLQSGNFLFEVFVIRKKIFVKLKFLVFVTLLLSASFPAGAGIAINPATDEAELILIPAAKERNMGRSIDQEIRKKFDIPVDPLIQERVEKLGERIAAGTDRKDLVYRFTVLDDEKDDNYNAFAVPGGYIYIFSDLVEKLQTDDTIAAVLAHEMGHEEARHAIKRLQGSLGATALMLLGTQMQSDPGSYAALNAAIGQLMAAYSRHDERQADELSIKYLKRAGFDPEGTIDALRALKKLRKKASEMKYFFYKSHPYLSERIAHLRNFIKGYTNFDSYINMVPRKSDF
jgi:predicted Zn-dependent protease